MKLSKILKDFWWYISASKTLNDLPDALIFVKFDGSIVKYNQKARQVFGLSKDAEDIELDFKNLVKDGMETLKKSNELTKPILTTAYGQGQEFYVEINAIKRFGGYCASIRDLTKLTDELVNDDKIARFNNEKNAMLAKLESDIKSPIISISGFSKGLLDGLGGNLSEKQEKYVKIINTNADELHSFMNDLLEFSKVESSIYEPEIHTFDVVEMLKSVTKEVDKAYPKKQFEFEQDFTSIDKRNICMDSFALKTIFKNILNVSMSMTETGFVYVKAEYPTEENCMRFKIDPDFNEKYLHITIADSGAGISKDEVKYLSEPYAQLEKNKKNFTRALKLGTATILIKRADGLFDLNSEVMKGTKYEIVLPILKGKDEQSNT